MLSLVLATALLAQTQPTMYQYSSTPGYVKNKGVVSTISHQPAEVLRALTGGLPKGVGLYEILSCSEEPTPMRISEGKIMQVFAQRIGHVNPMSVPGIMDRNKRRTKRYTTLKTLEYLGLGATLVATRGQASSTTNLVAFLGLAANGASSRINASLAPTPGVTERLLDALIDPTRIADIPPRGCIVRLSFGEYKPSNPSTFTVQITDY